MKWYHASCLSFGISLKHRKCLIQIHVANLPGIWIISTAFCNENILSYYQIVVCIKQIEHEALLSFFHWDLTPHQQPGHLTTFPSFTVDEDPKHTSLGRTIDLP